jgi:hypothetical protein
LTTEATSSIKGGKNRTRGRKHRRVMIVRWGTEVLI